MGLAHMKISVLVLSFTLIPTSSGCGKGQDSGAGDSLTILHEPDSDQAVPGSALPIVCEITSAGASVVMAKVLYSVGGTDEWSEGGLFENSKVPGEYLGEVPGSFIDIDKDFFFYYLHALDSEHNEALYPERGAMDAVRVEVACAEEEIVLDIMGPTEPVVGDTWTVWMRCDGTTMLGATILQFDPPDFASIQDNNATFLKVGAATMTMQVGRYSESLDVTVGKAKDR